MCRKRAAAPAADQRPKQQVSETLSTYLSGHLITKKQRTHRTCRVVTISIFWDKCSWKYILKWPLSQWFIREDTHTHRHAHIYRTWVFFWETKEHSWQRVLYEARKPQFSKEPQGQSYSEVSNVDYSVLNTEPDGKREVRSFGQKKQALNCWSGRN